MFQEEKCFTVRFSLEAHFPEDYDGDDEAFAWLREWEGQIKPDVVKSVFTTLRNYPRWSAHVRNRGIAPTEEIEISLVKAYPDPMKS